MDPTRGDEYIFNLKLSKLMGLYQILNPDDSVRFFGYNVVHYIIVTWGMFMMSVSILCPIGLYYLANDLIAISTYTGSVINFVFSCYKIANLLYYAKDIWRCTDLTGIRFLSHPRYDRNKFNVLRTRSLRLTNAYASLGVVATLFWMISSYAMSHNIVRVRNLDGSYNKYRMNIFNLYLIASERTYNKYFFAFYIVESLMGIGFMYFSALFDVLTIFMCLSVLCQMDTIADAIKLLGNRRPDTYEQFDNEFDVFDELKAIIVDHQNLMKKVKDYLSIFRSVMLTQIVVTSFTHIFIWFSGTMGILGDETGDSILSIKLFVILPLFTFQLFMTCSLFGSINEKKDSIVYALYCCNWTHMDLNTRKLILYAMRMNNSNQMNFKFTNLKVVNLEMFSNTIRTCYSIFSMLLNYIKNKEN